MNRLFPPALLVAIAALAPVRTARSQQGENHFRRNPGFENVSPENNLWDGVTADGSLAGRAYSMDALADNGFRSVAMPPSIAYADLNGDGKPDLLTVDPAGVFRFYENVGTVAEPRFKNAEILPLFISTPPHGRSAPRLALAPWSRSGNLDLLVGNYIGELLFIPNAGSPRQPIFRQPRTVDGAVLKTNPKGFLTTNLLSPAAGAWTGPGKVDLVVGEGTYSANAVRLYENIGTGSTPQFSDERSWYLAYGDGKEGLIPCVVDFDGDNRPDLLVADRTGQVSVYLNPGAGWKPGQELPFASKVSFGGSDRLPGLTSLCAVDFNGDGLFDLLLGLPNGRLAVALNIGTKGQPKFGPPQNLRGEKRLPPILNPSDWATNAWHDWGNLYGYLSVVDAAIDPDSKPPEGSRCLKAGYWPTANHVFAPPFESIPAEARQFEIKQEVPLELGHTYTLTFKVRGSGVSKFHYNLHADLHSAEAATQRVDQLERGVRKTTVSRFRNRNDALIEIKGEASPGSSWSTVSKTFQFQTRGKELPDGTPANAGFSLGFHLDRSDAVAYLDDFQLVENKR